MPAVHARLAAQSLPFSVKRPLRRAGQEGPEVLDAAKSRTRPLRVFIGVSEIAGYYKRLAEGFQLIGVDAVFVSYYKHSFEYTSEITPPFIVRLIRWSRDKKSGRFFERKLKKIVRKTSLLFKFIFLVQMMSQYDVFVFGFGRTIFHPESHLDLPIIRWFGKKIILMFNGSDSRPPWLEPVFHDVDSPTGLAELYRLSLERKAMLRSLERWADVVISHPLHGQYHEKPFAISPLIGAPTGFDLPENGGEKEIGRPVDRPIMAVHAPFNPAAKGTSVIRAAVEQLKAEGIDMELVEIQGRPNAEVLDALERCDFVIDQVYSDGLLPGFASEAAFFGKPAVVGGYELAEYRDMVPNEDHPPVMSCHPDDIVSAIRTLAVDDAFRTRLGADAREFMRTRWSREQVARRYVRLIDGDCPAEWMCDPSRIGSMSGAGTSKESLREFLRRYISRFGPEALQIDDKPELLAKVLRFSGAEASSADRSSESPVEIQPIAGR